MFIVWISFLKREDPVCYPCLQGFEFYKSLVILSRPCETQAAKH